MAAKVRCSWCGKGTTAKQFKIAKMCGACTKMHERFDYRQTMARVPQSVEEDLQEVILEQPTLDRAAAQMKKRYPLKHPMRDWDMALVILLDERRRNRAARDGRYGSVGSSGGVARA